MTRERRGATLLPIAISAGALLLLLLRATACTHDAEVVSHELLDAALLDTFVSDDVMSDAPHESGNDSGADVTLPDAALAPCSIGINPTFSAADGGSSVDLTLAELQTLGAGSRAGSFVLSFDTLLDAGGSVVPAEVDTLAATCALYRQHDAHVALTLALVDGARDARPGSLTGDWASSAAMSAVELLVDTVFSACGTLEYLGVGYQADRFLSQASAADRVGFAALATHAMDYARAHASRPASLKVGVVFSLQSLSRPSSGEQTALLAASDLTLVSELPLDAAFQVVSPQIAVDAIANLADADAGELMSRPIALVDLGYPSASAAGSSLADQRAFFDAFFSMLATHRARLPFVAINGLFDRDSASCERESARYGAANDFSLAEALCSLGLEASSPLPDGGSTKPALASVLAGLSAFSN